jgi:hypothetical protein
MDRTGLKEPVLEGAPVPSLHIKLPATVPVASHARPGPT